MILSLVLDFVQYQSVLLKNLNLDFNKVVDFAICFWMDANSAAGFVSKYIVFMS